MIGLPSVISLGFAKNATTVDRLNPLYGGTSGEGSRPVNRSRQAQSLDLSGRVPLDEAASDTIELAARLYGEKLFEYPAIGKAVKAYPGRPGFEAILAVAESWSGLERPCAGT
jgi:hypothetical protein